MKQKNHQHPGENVIPENAYIKAFPNNPVNKPFVKQEQSMQENDSSKKAEELLAPYYDEFHFANYE